MTNLTQGEFEDRGVEGSGKVGVYSEDVYQLYPRDRAVSYCDGETPPTE